MLKLGEDVIKIKRTKNGKMMYELKRYHEESPMECKEKIGSLLGEQTRIKLLGNEKTVVIKNLDKDKREIVTDVNSLSPVYRINTNAIKDMTKSFAGTQMAIVSPPSKSVADLLQNTRIKIG